MFSVLVILILSLFGLALYFLPTIIAQQKGHRSLGGIFALNLLLGWSLLGWIGALVWALSNPQPVVYVQNAPSYLPPQGYEQGSPQQPSYPQQAYPPPTAYPQSPVPAEHSAATAYVAQPATVYMPVADEPSGPRQPPL